MKFRRAEVQRRLENGVGLADELHVAVLDAVVHHFDVVTGAVGSHVTAAGLALGDSRDLRVDGSDRLPAFLRAAGHDGRALERALFTAADADAEEMNALLLEVLFAALGISPKGIATVDDDVARLEERDELLDHGVHRRTGLYHDLGLARTGEGGDKLFERASRDDVLPLRAASSEFFRDRRRPIIDADAKALAFHVENEILAHDGEAD